MFMYLSPVQSIIALGGVGGYMVFAYYDLKKALIALCAVLPLYIVEIQPVHHFILNALELLIFAIFLAALIRQDTRVALRRALGKLRTIGVVVIVLALWDVMGILISHHFALVHSMVWWGVVFVEPILLAIMLMSVVVDKNDERRIMQALFWSSVGVALGALVFQYEIVGEHVVRLQFFYTSPNYLAMVLVPAGGIGAYLWSTSARGSTKNAALILYGAAEVVLWGTIFLTESYGAIVGAVAGALVAAAFWYVRHPQQHRSLALWIMGGIVVLSVFMISQAHSQKIAELLGTSGRSSLEYRGMIWYAVWNMIAHHPFFGVGVGNFAYAIPPFLPQGFGPVPHANNVYLELLAEQGIGGAALFLLLGKRILSRIQYITGPFGELAVFYFISLTVWGLVDTVYFKNDLAATFWIFAALTLIAAERKPKKID